MRIDLEFKDIKIKEAIDICDICVKTMKEFGLSYKSSWINNKDNNHISLVCGDDDSDLIGSYLVKIKEVITMNYAIIPEIKIKGVLKMNEEKTTVTEYREAKTLKDTVNLMLGNDFKDRFRAEYYQLKIRMNSLETMLDKLTKGELDFKPKCPIGLLQQQLDTMRQYFGILQIRASIEDIDLGDGTITGAPKNDE
jgi:hypothetical protein